MNRLQEELFYINPETGSVAIGLEWMGDFEDQEDEEQTWEEWGGESLTEVFFNGKDWEELTFEIKQEFDSTPAEKASKMLVKYDDWNKIMSLADDDICKYIHHVYGIDNNQKFLEKYIELHRNKFNHDYEI